jgi:hypothetical protein
VVPKESESDVSGAGVLDATGVASDQAAIADDQATAKMRDENPGVFPVSISPFQLPVLPSLKDIASKKQDEKPGVEETSTEQPEIETAVSEKDGAQSVQNQLSSTPSLKGKVKTIHKADESKIISERKIKLERTTDISKEVSLQPIVPQPIEKPEAQSGAKQKSQSGSGQSAEGAGRKGSFPILNLPVIPQLNGATGKAKGTSRPTQTDSKLTSKPASKSGPEGKAKGKKAQPQSSRKIILDRVTAPRYESAPQAVTAPQPSGVPQSQEAEATTQGKPVKRQSGQESDNDNQILIIIAPPIKLPLRNIPLETDAGTQASERQP